MLDGQTLYAILSRYRSEVGTPVRGFDIAGRAFDFNQRRALVGVINLSPDSWYQESVCTTPEQAIARGLELARLGADIIDVGAESTLPDAARVSPDEQVQRLLPVLRPLAAQGLILSVETYHPEVMEAAAQAGARVFNLTGLQEEAAVLRLARRFEAAVIFCYLQGDNVRHVGDMELCDDMPARLESYFRECTARAEAQGVRRCIVDPGLGFYYRNLEDGMLRVNYQLHTFLHAFRLHKLGYPVMNILPHAPDIFGPEQRRAAEPFFAVLAMLGGTHIIRTHELPTVAKLRAALEAYRPAPGM